MESIKQVLKMICEDHKGKPCIIDKVFFQGREYGDTVFFRYPIRHQGKRFFHVYGRDGNYWRTVKDRGRLSGIFQVRKYRVNRLGVQPLSIKEA